MNDKINLNEIYINQKGIEQEMFECETCFNLGIIISSLLLVYIYKMLKIKNYYADYFNKHEIWQVYFITILVVKLMEVIIMIGSK